MRHASPPPSKDARRSLSAARQRQEANAQPSLATQTYKGSRTGLNSTLSSIGGDQWNSEDAVAAPTASRMRLFQAPHGSTGKRPLANAKSAAMYGSGGGRMLPSASTAKDPDPSPRSPPSPASIRRKRPEEKAPPDKPTPFRNTTVLNQRRLMTQSLKDAAEKDTRRKHVLRHLSSGARTPEEEGGAENAAQGSGTPYEVIARGRRAHYHFLKAMSSGTQRPRTLKLMFVGQGRAGKTSTLRRLTGRAFDSAEASTHGVSCESAACAFHTSTDLVSSWRVLGRPEHEVHRSELQKTFAREVVSGMKEEGMKEEDGDGFKNDVEQSPGSFGDGTPKECMPDSEPGSPTSEAAGRIESILPEATEKVTEKMPFDLITQYLEHGADGAPQEESVTLKTWDFAGQEEYYAMHHLFLTNRGIYLVVTRLDLWLPGAPSEQAAPLFDERARMQRESSSGDLAESLREHDGAIDPPLHALTFWISSIHIHAPNSIVAIVGTHKDKIRGQEEEVYARVEEEIQGLLQRVPGVDGQLVVNSDEGLCFFPVDNSDASADKSSAGYGEAEDGSGISTLRAALDQVAREALSEGGCFGEALPLKWVQLREELGELAQGTTGEPGQPLPMTALFVATLGRTLEIANELNIKDNEELVACLQYLHDTGSIVFFDEPELRDHVVLRPQWLTDAMAHVLNCPRVVRGANSGAKRLRERGELDADLLRKHLWKAPKFRDHAKVLLPLLHRYDLLLPYEETTVPGASLPARTYQVDNTAAASKSIADCQTLLVPCLLPAAPPPKPGELVPEVGAYDALFFDFHGMLCRLLPTLFPKLLVAATRIAEIEGPLSSLGVYRDSFKLLWGTAQLAFELLPSGERPQVLRVRLERWVGSAPCLGSGSCGLPLHIVRELLALVRTSLSQHHHLTFAAGILCEHCHARGRKLSEKHHVIDLSELLGEAMDTCGRSEAVAPPGNVICREQGEVVEIRDDSWVGQWRAEALSRARPRQASAEMPRALPEANETAGNDLFSDEDSVISTRLSMMMDDALKSASSAPSTVSSELPTYRGERSCCAGGANGSWRLNLLYASPLCYADEAHGSGSPDLSAINVEAELSLLWEATNLPDMESVGDGSTFLDSCATSITGSRKSSFVVDLATTSKLRQLLTSGGSAGRKLLLHLSLHCVEGGRALLMEDGNGGAHAIKIADFEALIRAGGGVAESVGFVFVNACWSDQLGQVLIALGVPHVICCHGAVFDAVARCFTKAFYLACARGFTIDKAFDVAKAEVRASPQPGLRAEAEKYFLFGSDDAGPEQHAVTLAEAAGPPAPAAGLETSHFGSQRSLGLSMDNSMTMSSAVLACWRPGEAGRLPPRTEDFCGRGRDLWLVQSRLSTSRRCLNCVGEEGIGKSALLTELTRFVSAPGRRFAGGAVYASVGANAEISSASAVASASSSPKHAEERTTTPNGVFSTRQFLVDLVEAARLAAGEESLLEEDVPLGAIGDEENAYEEEGANDSLGWSSKWCARHLKAMLLRLLKQLENRRSGGEVLLIIDDIDAYVLQPALADEVRKTLTEILLRTERTMLVLGSRRQFMGTLGSHKVVALPMPALQPADAARLFLWRLHRPLTLRDLSAAGVDSDCPLVMDPRNRQMVLSQVANHPLLQACRGHPGVIRQVADMVRPGENGDPADSLYEIYEQVFGAEDCN